MTMVVLYLVNDITPIDLYYLTPVNALNNNDKYIGSVNKHKMEKECFGAA